MDTNEIELVLLFLLGATVLLVLLAQASRVPYPIFLVVGGALVGVVPGMPDIELDPDLVLVIFLPPLLYSAAFFSSLRDLRANLRPIALLSIGLVIFTTLSVALVAHALIDGMSWPTAFVLGAIVSPTDPIAATTIARRLGAPRRYVTIVEGESLINDGTALVLYKTAVAAVVGGSFSLIEAGGELVLSAVGGVAIGLAVAWVIAQIRVRLDNAPTEITISIATGYFAYLPAELAGVSGVLAALAAGIYLGWQAPRLITPPTRLQAFGLWEVLVFLLNSTLFILIGLQLPRVVEGIEGLDAGEVAVGATAVSLTVVIVRFLWVFPATYLPRRLSAKLRERDPIPPWSSVTLVAWTGMRGAVALAAALALPLETDTGGFPQRDLIIFIAFCVIFVTLVLQGLSLPALISRLGAVDDGAEAREEIEARRLVAEAAIERVDELVAEDYVREDTAQRMRGLYDYRRRRFAAQGDGDGDDEGYEERSADFQRFRAELIEAERQAMLGLRREGRISDDVMHRIERDLDLEHSRLEG